ncbi:MAG: hypothetical protein HC785_29080 [Calothrix sp. CSU_2_0]|nr:hypothetical protein [Calothrix sp. CSU_2_0]
MPKIQAKHVTCVGEVKAIAQQLDAKQWRISFTPNIEGFVGDVVVTEKIGKSKPETRIRHHIDEWLRSLNFQVYKANATPAQWVEAKWCESGEHYEPMRKCHTFVDVDGQLIKISGHGRDRIRVVRKC